MAARFGDEALIADPPKLVAADLNFVLSSAGTRVGSSQCPMKRRSISARLELVESDVMSGKSGMNARASSAIGAGGRPFTLIVAFLA